MTKVNELLRLLHANDCPGGFNTRVIRDTMRGKDVVIIEATGFNGFRLEAGEDSFEKAVEAAIAKLTKGKA